MNKNLQRLQLRNKNYIKIRNLFRHVVHIGYAKNLAASTM